MTRALLVAVALAGCYSPPKPDCGFVCGPGGACPDDYTWASDHHCHRNGTPDSLDCGRPPADAGPDTSFDAPASHIVTLIPANGATGINVDTAVEVVADQDLQGSPDLTLSGSTGAQVAGTALFIANGIRFTPDAQLDPNELYTATISASVVTQNAVPLGPFQWTFTTGADDVAPELQASTPAANDTAVPVTTGIRVHFDEPVTGVDATSFTAANGVTPIAGNIVMIDTRTAELQPVSNLPAASTITVSLGSGIMDASGNAFAGYSFSFTTQ